MRWRLLAARIACWGPESWEKLGNRRLASCPWGPVTANGVDLLTEIYVIYIESHIPKIMPIGPLAAAGEVATHVRKES